MEQTLQHYGNGGDSTHWRTTAGRFQIVYDASHFLGKNGVTGPITITRVKFRGEDGEANKGTQTYANVTVEVGATSVTSAAMSTNFATNRDPLTTTMGPLGTIATVTVAPSVGSCPNNYCIDLDLVAAGAAFTFDPNSTQPNLLIDITMPTAPVNPPTCGLIPIQDTTAHGAGIRGRTVSSATPTAATGTSDATPAVVGIEFVGPGGWATIVPARNEYIGASCGTDGCSTFYETFMQGQPFDITGLTLIPDNAAAPNVYTVVPGVLPVDVTRLNATPNTSADEGVHTHNLSFTWAYPGGTTTVIKPTGNGFVWLDGAMTAANWQTTLPNLLGSGATNYTARYLPYWCDLVGARNTPSDPLAGVHVQEDTSGGPGNTVVYVTWWNMGYFRTTATGSGHVNNTFQVVMYQATGIVEYRYGPMAIESSPVWTASTSNEYAPIVGFTRGRIAAGPPVVGSQNPQSRDLSVEGPFSTAIEGTRGNVSLTAVATPIAGSPFYNGRMFGGQSLRWNVANIPPVVSFGILNLDLGATRPGFQLPSITAPGCMMSTTLNPVVFGWESFVVLPPTSSFTGTLALVVPHGWEGTEIYAQAIGIDLSGGPDLIAWASNTIKSTVGLD